MKKIIFIGLVALISFSGCSRVTYTVEPTPLKKESSKYYLKDLQLTLNHGVFRNSENNTFCEEKCLQEEFKNYIQEYLREKQIYDVGGYGLVVKMDYTRHYHLGGNSLNKPAFFYSVEVYAKDNKTLLAHYKIPNSTTKYAYLEELLVDTKVLLFQWDAEDEPKDIALISEVIVREISKLGD
ncbi:hypothetical protein [Dokdonella sp.]|uniref:hypothetical protein n=1 Tax=Dokdonella sp. TaxID=2291710 RepID=UPI002FC109D3|nr:hypothetical protein [Dokdonella sp.]